MVVVDDHHARTLAHDAGARFITSSTSVPSPGWLRTLGVAAVTLHARDDRVAHAAPVGRDRRAGRSPRRGRGRTPPPVGHRPPRTGPRALTGELGGVGHRLARRRHDRLQPRPAARRRRSPPRSARGAAPRPRRRRAPARRPRCPARSSSGRREQPAAQLALLAARQARHLARIARALLDQRQRLQHRVVQVRGELGALLLADAGRTLEGEAAQQAHAPSARRPG